MLEHAHSDPHSPICTTSHNQASPVSRTTHPPTHNNGQRSVRLHRRACRYRRRRVRCIYALCRGGGCGHADRLVAGQQGQRVLLGAAHRQEGRGVRRRHEDVRALGHQVRRPEGERLKHGGVPGGARCHAEERDHRQGPDGGRALRPERLHDQERVVGRRVRGRAEHQGRLSEQRVQGDRRWRAPRRRQGGPAQRPGHGGHRWLLRGGLWQALPLVRHVRQQGAQGDSQQRVRRERLEEHRDGEQELGRPGHDPERQDLGQEGGRVRVVAGHDVWRAEGARRRPVGLALQILD